MQLPKQMIYENLKTVKEIASDLRVSPKTIYEWVRKGSIPYIKLGRNLRFSSEELAEWLRKKGANYGKNFDRPPKK